jgi:hypothetical protein
MFSNNEMMDLVGRLFIATRQGRIKWQDTAEEEMFRTNFKQGSVRVGVVGGYNEEVGEFQQFKIVVLNKEGKIADEYIPDSASDISRCKELFVLARRSARDTDNVLSEIFEELKEQRS